MAAANILLSILVVWATTGKFTTAVEINSGFLVGNSADGSPFSLKVVDKVSSLIHCRELKFGDDGATDVVGSSPFKLMKSKHERLKPPA